ncbi:LOW QUALITY PROTEIN: NADH-ubiquinone oxidoreductase chain L [Liberibacter crescens BT-1]|uniref:NADH-ubiquinone oxidoreductase chain 5 n=2 Tax=Liberibacter crescens TaxID=1273132 RepID=L0EV38_LIBCB|nr:LOW QUALITY PROTEIN: NADH-ubiquinone oxidoreductase chain L [Liberibacter crescens BT-1]
MIYKAIVFLPLLGALISGFFGRFIGSRGSELVTSTLMFIVALLSWNVFLKGGFGELSLGIEKIEIARWVQSGEINVSWAFRVDRLTSVMFVVVNSISFLVHVYSIGYMHHDPHRTRFFSYLSLFTFFMLMLVTSDNILQMFFGWEGVGLTSYLLIGFWFSKESAIRASMKAFIINRVGDLGFLIGIAAIFVLFGSINFDVIFSKANFYPTVSNFDLYEPVINILGIQFRNSDAITLVCLLLFTGAMGKSAQFLLHTWLPDAMEGPTPVSALIHAATMVTAGIFLIARMSPIFELSPVALNCIMFIGAITAFFASTVGLVQNDIKRVVAYSTCSQLGYMFVALGAGAYGASVFHLFTHAFFKALLFLGAGSVIHAVNGEQDMRHMGGLYKYLPSTFFAMMIGNLALTGLGIPGTNIGFAGFFSKDAIIESSYVSYYPAAGFCFVLLVIAAFFTSFYSWRLMFLTFFGKIRVSPQNINHIHESPWVMLVPLYVLSIGAIFSGFLFQDFFFGEKYEFFWKGALFTSSENHILEAHHFVPIWVKLCPFIAFFAGFISSFIMYIIFPSLPGKLSRNQSVLYNFLLNAWYFDQIYDFLFVRPAQRFGFFLWKKIDAFIDNFGPNGLASVVRFITKRVVRLQTGYLYHYVFAMLIGVVVLVAIMIGKGNG